MPHLSMAQKVKNIKFYKNDIPLNIKFKHSIAIDTETMGLNINNDRLCLVQISDEHGNCHIIQFQKDSYNAPNLKKILNDKRILKIFHYARFDVGILNYTYGINIQNIYCTKISSKLSRTFTDKHGYKDLCLELLNKKINKNEQTSDWGAKKITSAQQRYAATDVLFLHELRIKLNEILKREKRIEMAQACFNFIEHRVRLDLSGWPDLDIFKH